MMDQFIDLLRNDHSLISEQLFDYYLFMFHINKLQMNYICSTISEIRVGSLKQEIGSTRTATDATHTICSNKIAKVAFDVASSRKCANFISVP